MVDKKVTVVVGPYARQSQLTVSITCENVFGLLGNWFWRLGCFTVYIRVQKTIFLVKFPTF